MLHEAPAIPRFGIPEYNWWNECLHGVARAGIATVFPQAIGLAAMWSAAAHVADRRRRSPTRGAPSTTSSRARTTAATTRGSPSGRPNINIFRDPRWGRGHETYGECPHLTGRLGVAFCEALQGDHPKYLKLVATPKHFAVHSGPEGLRHSFNAVASPEGSARDVSAGVSRLHHRGQGVQHHVAPTTAPTGSRARRARRCLVDILREEWKFEGYVVSDCWAIRDIHEHHKVTGHARGVRGGRGQGRLRSELRLHLRAHPRRRRAGLARREADLDVCCDAPVRRAPAPRHVRSGRSACRTRRFPTR